MADFRGKNTYVNYHTVITVITAVQTYFLTQCSTTLQYYIYLSETAVRAVHQSLILPIQKHSHH